MTQPSIHTMPTAAVVFEQVLRIRFSHCDPAGIVFFPQYLVLFNQVVEDWFTDGLGVPYATLLGTRRIGLPIVRLECDFRAISRMGDAVVMTVAVERAGGKSLQLHMQCLAPDGGVRVSARKVLVFTDLDSHQAIAMPEDVRQALAGSDRKF